LIEKLDPQRDYGERTYSEVVAGIRAGNIQIADGPDTLPVLRMQRVGDQFPSLIKGSGRNYVNKEPHKSTLAHTRQRFMEKAHEDFDDVYGALLVAAKEGDVRAQKIFMEMYIGRPKEVTDTVNESMMNRLFDMALRPREEVIEIHPS